MQEKNIVFVGQEYRTNPLSAAPGGSVVEVHYENIVKVYDNIKNPRAYVKYITSNSAEAVISILVDGKPYNF
jgi:hypothetical protein